MSAHTPGPWGVDGRQVWAAKTLVCWISTPSGVDAPVDAEGDANARLIASAPELLAALRDVTDLAALTALTGETSETVKRARAAIARAEGVRP